jgi:hypothetical protein
MTGVVQFAEDDPEAGARPCEEVKLDGDEYG